MSLAMSMASARKAIISAILAGERDADKLAKLRDRRCRSSLEKVKAALVGDYREEPSGAR